MKRKFSKILGVGLTLALITSLLLVAAPVSALTQPSVTVAPTTISAANADYNIRFQPDKQLSGDVTSVTAGAGAYNLVEDGDSFVITAAAATDVATISLVNGTVTGTMSGTGTFAANVATFAAIGETCTVTVLTVDAAGLCDGTWAQTTGSPTAAVGVGAAATDTITIVFPSDTAVAATPTVTMVAGPGWINGFWLGATTPAFTSVVGTADTRTVVITLATTTRIGEGAEVRLSFTTGLTNPTIVGSYNLTVKTSKETTAVTSAAYAIEVPTIPGLPGVANVYNPAGTLMAQKNDLALAIAAAGVDYTIQVGPGTYAGGLTINHEGLTFVSTAGAATTIIEGTIAVTGAEVTVGGFTVEVTSGSAISVTGADAIVQNNIITAEDGWPEGINLGSSGATVSGNELSINTTMMVIGATDCTLSDNTFGAGINVQGSTGIDITDNDITGSEFTGIVFESTISTDILIEGNTISGTIDAEGTGIRFKIGGSGIQIIGNDITDNEGEAIQIDSTVSLTDPVIKFNTITGNNIETGDHAIQNDTAVDVDATFNWWGTDVAADIDDMVSDDVIYEPFLADAVATVLSASDTAAGETSLDAKTTVGVRVSITDTAKTAIPATTISVAKYVANPQAAIDDAIAFFDVYVVGTGAATTDLVTIKFYAGDENTEVWIWSADTESWAPVDADFSVYGGYVYVTVFADVLDGTPFALVGGEAVADELNAPDLATPTSGASDVSLTPIFAWEAVTDADGYYFEFADNANFVLPLAKLDGDTGRLIVTAYAYVGELPYTTAYYWRVKAVSGTIDAGDLAESGWASAVFITMDEPVEPIPPIVIEPTPPAPIITIEQPDIIIPLPDVVETPITPSWIYVIIGVGAVLVIALLVLIVRTRRVA